MLEAELQRIPNSDDSTDNLSLTFEINKPKIQIPENSCFNMTKQLQFKIH